MRFYWSRSNIKLEELRTNLSYQFSDNKDISLLAVPIVGFQRFPFHLSAQKTGTDSDWYSRSSIGGKLVDFVRSF